MNENDAPKKKWTTTLRLEKNEITKQTKQTMNARIITAVVLALLVVPAIFIGGWVFLALSTIMLIIAVVEALQAIKIKKRYWLVYLSSIFIVFLITFWLFIKYNVNANLAQSLPALALGNWDLYASFNKIEVSSLLIVVLLIGLLILLVADKNFGFDTVAYIFLFLFFLAIGVQSFVFLRFFPTYLASVTPSFTVNWFTSSFLFVYIILGTIANDIGAYFMGVYYGKTKMNPRLSPNKTWEGFIWGILISMALSFLLGMSMSWLGHPLLPFLTHHEWYYILLLSLLIPLFANIGDLFFSAAKRHLNIKDYGFILVGHGGVLDRVDSIIFVAITVSTFIVLLGNGWSVLV